MSETRNRARTFRQCRASPTQPSGFALIDLVVVSFVIAVVMAIGVHFVQQARIKARATGCRDNLRQIGAAVAQYTDVHRTLPVVQLAGAGFQLAHSPHALLLSYLPQAGPIPYDPARPWFQQAEGIGAVTIPIFRCPASSHRDPVDADQARRANCPLGNLLGTTDYIVCKGASDTWCMSNGVSDAPPLRRGAFEIGRPLRPSDIVDGLSATMVFGEGTAGNRWPIGIPAVGGRVTVYSDGGRRVPAYNFWCWPFLNTLSEQYRTKIVATSVFGTTAIRMNARTVVETLVNTEKLDDCMSAGGNRAANAVSGFRSDHYGGAFFLFADGSIRFLNEDVDRGIYEALSTIAGGESVQYVD
jgi:hypothetical protein